MELPKRPKLPFFAYGIFRPGQLGFFQLKGCTHSVRPGAIRGELRIRDGLPIVDSEGTGEVRGSVLFFKPGSCREAYKRILKIEPDVQYRWGETRAQEIQEISVNVLWGKSPRKGSILSDQPEWDGKQDPLFTSALDVVQETLNENKEFEQHLKPLFRLQMAYLLLWSAIERYVSLRYHLGDKVNEKVKRLAEESAFAEALQEFVSQPREVFRSQKPTEKIRLDVTNPKNSLDYYYQIRCNITHRGKTVMQDHERLYRSLAELLPIFRRVLQQAFEEAALPDA